MQYFLGIDAGGTKTHAVIIDENSKVLGEAFGGPANYHNIDLEQVSLNIFRTIENVVSKVFIKEEYITWTTIGVASCDTPKDYQILSQAFSSGNLQSLKGKLTLVNDVKVGLYSGTLPPAIVVVCGTGCNVYGVNGHGEEAAAGNWGHFFGDGGSAYQMAKRMFRAVVADYDDTGEKTQLREKIEQKLNVKTIEELVDWDNENRPTIHQISDFAPLVLEVAESGDEVAKQIVDQGINSLGRALLSVVKRLKVEDEYNRIVTVGGLFESKYFRALFEGHVTALLKRVRIVKPLVSPAVGAAIMAKAEWGKQKEA